MKICIIGEHSPRPCEAMISTASYLVRELSKRHEVLFKNVRDIFVRDFWKDIRAFSPQIIHYIPGPSIISFAITKALSLYYRNAKIVMSALHPDLPLFSKIFIRLLKPDLILSQSYESEQMFTQLGCRTAFLPSGVNTEKFIPVSKAIKATLRKKYGFNKERFTVLHVGHFLKIRGLEIFGRVVSEDNQVIIVGSPYGKPERGVWQKLEEMGCLVFRDYFENIEEIYALSDCFLFPTKDKLGSVEMPLSVIEAMSCNLPVISTKFGALPRVFEPGDGLIFVDDTNGFVSELEKLKNNSSHIEVKTREKSLPFSWDKVTERLEEIYDGLLS